MSKKLYHGSNVIVEHPDIRIRVREYDRGMACITYLSHYSI